MATSVIQYIGRGVYSVPEAARLTEVSAPRIRRWLRGYEYKVASGAAKAPPVWSPQLPVVNGQPGLTFRDLLEVRFVDAFLKMGVTWAKIRRAAERGQELLNDTHPFSSRRFRTDGIDIFAELSGDMIEVGHQQRYFDSVIRPYLVGVEFEGESPARWWPLGKTKKVVIDPARSFGQPIVSNFGVPTAVLARAVQKSTVNEVALWYEVDVRTVRLAIEFEERLAA